MGNWRFFSISPEVSGPLSLWGFGVMLGCLFASILLVVPSWAVIGLLAAAGALAVLALWGAGRQRFFIWWLLGFCLAAAVALARGDQGGWERLPVRFSGTVRDGWRLGETGWRTRFRLWSLEGMPRRWQEVTLTVGGSSHPGNLPPPGSRVEGAGEMVRLPGPGKAGELRVKSPLLLKAHAPAGVDLFRERTRQRLVQAAGFSPRLQRAAALGAALVLGRREGLGEGEVESLQEAGLAHILAVSGLHVGLVVGTFWLLLLAFGVRPGMRRWFLIPVAVGFSLVAGGSMPVRRATLATVLLLVARSLGRPVELLPLFWGVVGVLLLSEPRAVWDPGFQLSAGVALALVRWVPTLQARLGKGRVAGAVAVAVVAQLASSPVLGLHFAALPALAMPLNLLAIPMAAVLVVLALGACLWVWVAPVGTTLWLAALGTVSSGMQALASLGEGTILAFPQWPVILLAIFAVLFPLSCLPWPGALAAFGGVVMMTVASALWPFLPASGTPQVTMVPVRQGMALWIATPQGSVLVDAGRGSREVVQGLAGYKGSGRLTSMVLTHPDRDHIGGAVFALKVLRPQAVFLPGAQAQRPEFLPLRWQAVKRHVPLVPLWPGQRVRVGDLVFDVLWPRAGLSLGDNDASLVLRCQLGGVSLLLVGDLAGAGEQAVLALGEVLTSPILQVGHHGSRSSSTLAFLQAVSPRIALIPTGTSPRFPFPSPAVLKRLRQVRALPLSQAQGLEGILLHPQGDVEVRGTSVFLRVKP